MKKIIFISVLVTLGILISGCKMNGETTASEPATRTPEEIARLQNTLGEATYHATFTKGEINQIPDGTPHKDGAKNGIDATLRSLGQAEKSAENAGELAKKDAKEIEKSRSEVAAKIRGWAWPFLIGGFAGIAGGIVALKFGMSLGTTLIRIGAGSLLAGILILSFANTIANIVSIATIIMTACAVVVAVWFVWHWIAYMRRGENIIAAAGNAAGDVAAGQAKLD